MKRYLLQLVTLLTLFATPFPGAATAGDDARAADVKRDVEKTLDLWRDGRFEEVYGRVGTGGSHSKEYLVSHLAAAPRKPSCCWEKLQEVRVTVQDLRRATFHARFGFDTGTGVEFTTRELKVELDNGVWKMRMADLLSLSGKGLKVRGGKKKVH